MVDVIVSDIHYALYTRYIGAQQWSSCNRQLWLTRLPIVRQAVLLGSGRKIVWLGGPAQFVLEALAEQMIPPRLSPFDNSNFGELS